MPIFDQLGYAVAPLLAIICVQLAYTNAQFHQINTELTGAIRDSKKLETFFSTHFKDEAAKAKLKRRVGDETYSLLEKVKEGKLMVGVSQTQLLNNISSYLDQKDKINGYRLASFVVTGIGVAVLLSGAPMAPAAYALLAAGSGVRAVISSHVNAMGKSYSGTNNKILIHSI